jgi:hypothetical protein
MDQAIKLIEQIETLREKQDKCLSELKKSLRIKALWPEAFKLGAVNSTVTGNPRRALIFTITRGDGESRQFPLTDIPLELWPAQVLEDMKRPGANPHYQSIIKGEK